MKPATARGADLPVSSFSEGWKHRECLRESAVRSKASPQVLNSLLPSKASLGSHLCSWKGTLFLHSLVKSNQGIAGTFSPVYPECFFPGGSRVLLIMQVINSQKIQGKLFAESCEKCSTNVFLPPRFGVAVIYWQPGTVAQLMHSNSLAMVFHCLSRW